MGDPNGSYNSYSFGVDGNSFLSASVYIDDQHGGNIEDYKKTTSLEDSDFIKDMNSKIGDSGVYGVDDICRSWSQRQFMNAPGVKSTAPYRNTVPHINVSPSSTRSTTGGFSTTGTGTSK